MVSRRVTSRLDRDGGRGIARPAIAGGVLVVVCAWALAELFVSAPGGAWSAVARWIVFGFAAAVCVVVNTLLLASVLRADASSVDDSSQPALNRLAEFGWTALPAVVLLALLAFSAWAVYFS